MEPILYKKKMRLYISIKNYKDYRKYKHKKLLRIKYKNKLLPFISSTKYSSNFNKYKKKMAFGHLKYIIRNQYNFNFLLKHATLCNTLIKNKFKNIDFSFFSIRCRSK